MNKTHATAFASMIFGHIFMGIVPVLVPLIAMSYLPKLLLEEMPEQIVKQNKINQQHLDFQEIVFQSSKKQYLYYGSTVACFGVITQSFFKLSFGFYPVLAFHAVYLNNLQQKGELTEFNGLKSIGLINLLFFIQGYNSTGPGIFLDSVGNNLVLIAYTFYIVNQQKIADYAAGQKFLDELNTIFASFQFQKLSLQQFSWKDKAYVTLVVLLIAIAQIYVRTFVKGFEIGDITVKGDGNVVTKEGEQKNSESNEESVNASQDEQQQQIKQQQEQYKYSTNDPQYYQDQQQQQFQGNNSNINSYENNNISKYGQQQYVDHQQNQYRNNNNSNNFDYQQQQQDYSNQNYQRKSQQEEAEEFTGGFKVEDN